MVEGSAAGGDIPGGVILVLVLGHMCKTSYPTPYGRACVLVVNVGRISGDSHNAIQCRRWLSAPRALYQPPKEHTSEGYRVIRLRS